MGFFKKLQFAIGRLRQRMEHLKEFLLEPPDFIPVSEPESERRTISFFVVRTGSYVGFNTGPLSDVGREQARQAAKVIEARLQGKPVVVINPPDHHRCYNETSEIIAAYLADQCRKQNLDPARMVRVDFLLPRIVPVADELSIYETEYRRGIRHFVVVINGTHINTLLQAFSGGHASLGPFGVGHGVVQEIKVTYQVLPRQAYQVLEQRFI